MALVVTSIAVINHLTGVGLGHHAAAMLGWGSDAAGAGLHAVQLPAPPPLPQLGPPLPPPLVPAARAGPVAELPPPGARHFPAAPTFRFFGRFGERWDAEASPFMDFSYAGGCSSNCL